VEVIDLNCFDLPLFSVDTEATLGKPAAAIEFLKKIEAADALVASFAEHNCSFTAAYKNLFDWASRINRDVYQHKPAVFLATSPGPRGGANVLEVAKKFAPRFGGNVRGSLSIPSFYENFDLEKGRLTDDALSEELQGVMNRLLDQ